MIVVCLSFHALSYEGSFIYVIYSVKLQMTKMSYKSLATDTIFVQQFKSKLLLSGVLSF
jgi:hypothetical protein